MKKRFTSAFLCAFLFLLSFGVPFARPQTVGVSIGGKFTYSYVLAGTHDKSLTWDPWMLELNQSRWELTITNVNGTRITYQLKIFFSNGTEQDFPSLLMDVFSGGSNGPNYMFFI